VQEILAILDAEHVHPSAWIWVHAHHLTGVKEAIQAAAQGAWISFDGLNESSAAHILTLVREIKAGGYLDRVLLSHDGDSYCNGAFRPYHYLLTTFNRMLQESGLCQQEIRLLTVDNPRRAFTVRTRRTG
jgi:phosphotriesterase-related protein